MQLLRKLWALWKAFGHALGQVQTAILLGIIYHVAIGPISLVSRLLRREMLSLRQPQGSSYATTLAPVSSTLERAQRQF